MENVHPVGRNWQETSVKGDCPAAHTAVRSTLSTLDNARESYRAEP